MMRKPNTPFIILTLFLISLLLLSACNKLPSPTPGTPPTPPSTKTGDTPPTPSTPGTTGSTFKLQYCTTALRNAELTVKSAQRLEEREKKDVDLLKQKLEQAKTANDAEKIKEKEEELKEAQEEQKDAQEQIQLTQGHLTSLQGKCATLEKKADSEICQEFLNDIDTEIAKNQQDLQEHQKKQEDVKTLLENAKQEQKSREILKSIQKELESESFQVLKYTNFLDKLAPMRKELKDWCKL